MVSKMIYAKSDGTTLKQHINDCLIIWKQLQNSIPKLTNIFGDNDFWLLLFISVYLHDFGKGHKEFQKYLAGENNNWFGQRHELYSIPFVDKLNIQEQQRLLVKRTIIGHHKDYEILQSKYYKDKNLLEFEFEYKFKDRGFQHHPEEFLYNLQSSLDIKSLKILIDEFDILSKKYGFQNINMNNKVVLSNQQHPYETIIKRIKQYPIDTIDYWQNLLLWGGLKICDHYGSAGITQIPALSQKHFEFIYKMRQKLQTKGKDLFYHQKVCMKQNKNCLLIAPTGSGKTEAAIGWLQNQLTLNQGHAFYILPFTASINAMHKRLIENMDPLTKNGLSDFIGIQHGKLSQYLATYYENTPILKRNIEIKKLREQYKRLAHPLKVITPFQILKYCYGVKGFELGITQLAGAKLIFDEIHAYDPSTFAQILVMLKFLISHLHCNVMVMTATLPYFMLRKLQKVLDVVTPVQPELDFLNKNPRHYVKIIDGEIYSILNEIDNIILQNKRIIIVCNTVQRAQKIYESILQQCSIDKDEINMIHSRYIAKDRFHNEKKAFDKKTKILIGTQAIEVSLDIDYDIMFTEPAPLDALLQRFGRINRKGLNPPCPVYICRNGGPYDSYIYPQSVVNRTISVLEKIEFIYESQVQNMLDTVYPDWEPEQKQEFHLTLKTFQASLQSLQPYTANKENENEFYEKFTGIQVLPAFFFNDYKQCLEQFDYIRAEELLVTIHKGMYFKLKNNPQGSQIEIKTIDIFNKDNSIKRNYVVVAKCKYNKEIGMTDEYQEILDNPFL